MTNKNKRKNTSHLFGLPPVMRFIIGLSLAIVFFVMLVFMLTRNNGLSKDDFSALEGAGRSSLLAVLGEIEITERKTCNYVRPEESADRELYCSIAMVAYAPYDTESVLRVARDIEASAKSIGTPLGPARDYTNTLNLSVTIPVNLGSPLPASQCNFGVYTQDSAKSVGNGLPDNFKDNQIAVMFTCQEKAAEPYYPVIYVQG